MLDEVARRGFRLNAQGRLQGVVSTGYGSLVISIEEDPEMRVR